MIRILQFKKIQAFFNDLLIISLEKKLVDFLIDEEKLAESCIDIFFIMLNLEECNDRETGLISKSSNRNRSLS